MMEHISRQRFWTWPEMRREDWFRWFEAHDLSLDDIADFSIDEENAEVKARVYLKDDNGRRYLHGDEVASESVTIVAEVLDVGGVADRPEAKTKLNVPPYHPIPRQDTLP